MPPAHAELARRLIAYRIEHNLTQAQLGEKAGLGYSVISRHERGDRAVGFETLAAIGKVLGFEVRLVDLAAKRKSQGEPVAVGGKRVSRAKAEPKRELVSM